jgi:hypothetical protein
MQWFGVRRALPHCLLFGALIPNRPDRRDGILAESGSSPARRSRYCGASLYSGVIRLGGINLEQPGGSSGDTGGIDVFAAGGGLALGLVLGYVRYYLLGSVDNYKNLSARIVIDCNTHQPRTEL